MFYLVGIVYELNYVDSINSLVAFGLKRFNNAIDDTNARIRIICIILTRMKNLNSRVEII